MTSPDLWGVVVVEANPKEQVIRAISVWRVAAPGFFKMTKTVPAMPVQEILPILAGVSQKLNG
jgi:hypothetical protein